MRNPFLTLPCSRRVFARLTREQASTFGRDGAVGSHLENIQRSQGFKGFNQKSVQQEGF
ncbi:MAG: hypothetical protein ABSG33_04330 [Candidatus Bathyarchaeia archaeon]